MPDWTYTNRGVIDYLLPGTKVKIGQYLYASPGQRYWAILVIGAFYDSNDNELWRKEIFIRKTEGRGSHNAWPQQFDDGSGPPPAFALAALNSNNISIIDTLATTTLAQAIFSQWLLHSQSPWQASPGIGLQFSSPVLGLSILFVLANSTIKPDAMAFYPPAGHNPLWGRDSGPAPPLASMGRAAPRQPQQYGFQYCNFPFAGGYTIPPSPVYQQSPIFGSSGRYPQPRPVLNPAMPAANMTNATGGIGCEPGYNYFFPAEHTKVHVLKTGATPPWQCPANHTIPFHACHIPVNTTIGELLKGFGATNSSAKLNKVFEITQGGNGKWYRGLCFSGDEKDNMKKSLKEVGWDKTRSGLPGGKPVVYLYITKN